MDLPMRAAVVVAYSSLPLGTTDAALIAVTRAAEAGRGRHSGRAAIQRGPGMLRTGVLVPGGAIAHADALTRLPLRIAAQGRHHRQ